VAQYGQIVRAISGPGAVLIFIHHHVQSPLQAFLDVPVPASHLMVSLRALAGCGGLQDQTPMGTSMVTISATGGGISQSLTIAVSVEK
jgi:hypothetical protein